MLNFTTYSNHASFWEALYGISSMIWVSWNNGLKKIYERMMYCESKKGRNSTKKAIKEKKSKNSTQKVIEKKKDFFFIFSLSSSCFLDRFLGRVFFSFFLFSYFLVFFYKFPPQISNIRTLGKKSVIELGAIANLRPRASTPLQTKQIFFF